MLLELRAENLLLIERAELRLAPGLNVITGETGAGKTMLAHALDLLLGGKARPGAVRPGAGEAWVEGVFDLPAALRDRLEDRPPAGAGGLGPARPGAGGAGVEGVFAPPAALRARPEARLPADAEELVLARRVGGDGRTRAYLGGRTATVADLREVGEELLAFYGQHEHRRLTLASAQLEVLDGYCGPEQRDRRAGYAASYAEARAARAEMADLAERAGGRERELDLLRFELAEIEAADPSEAEAAELTAERERLRHLETLRAAALAGTEAVAPESGGPGVAFLLAEAGRYLDGAAGVDPALDALAERWRSLALEADDLAGELRRYESDIEAPPGR